MKPDDPVRNKTTEKKNRKSVFYRSFFVIRHKVRYWDKWRFELNFCWNVSTDPNSPSKLCKSSRTAFFVIYPVGVRKWRRLKFLFSKTTQNNQLNNNYMNKKQTLKTVSFHQRSVLDFLKVMKKKNVFFLISFPRHNVNEKKILLHNPKKNELSRIRIQISKKKSKYQWGVSLWFPGVRSSPPPPGLPE